MKIVGGVRPRGDVAGMANAPVRLHQSLVVKLPAMPLGEGCDQQPSVANERGRLFDKPAIIVGRHIRLVLDHGHDDGLALGVELLAEAFGCRPTRRGSREDRQEPFRRRAASA